MSIQFDFRSGHDLRVMRLSPTLGSTLSGESEILSLSLSLLACSLSLSLEGRKEGEEKRGERKKGRKEERLGSNPSSTA